MNLLAIILDELLSLALLVVLMRLLLQLVRADFRNPICQAIVRLTNPLIIPLRRVLPPIRKLDTATVVAVLVIAFVLVAVGFALPVRAFPLNGMIWIMQALLTVAYAILWIYFWSIIVYALLSLVAPGGYSPMQSVLASLTEPVLGPIRRLIPSFAGIDLSPLWACLAIQVILYFLPRPLFFAW
ncbi:MAG TPA: YggT family protein [Steroidobacteraceae bacterium]|nr:YggT family protein [Steroidobacteraceae bacterium]